jgi:hypothetical protein
MHYCICDYVVIAAFAYMVGFNLGGFMMWVVLSRMPYTAMKDRTWREVDH